MEDVDLQKFGISCRRRNGSDRRPANARSFWWHSHQSIILLANHQLSARMSRNLYTTDQAEENRRKPRFDPLNPQFIRPDEEEDAEEDAGFVDDVGLSKTGAKRKKVRTDVSPSKSVLVHGVNIAQGYDSDSSQEGDVKKSKKSKTKPADDDDDDMFNDAPPEPEDANDEEDAYGKLKKKKVSFVDASTFEGQVIDRDEPRDIEDEVESVPSTPNSSDNEQVDEEVGLAGLKKHAPKLERFNLRQEQAEGLFTEDGSYVRKAADPKAHQDAWMEGLTKGQIKRAEEGMRKQLEREQEMERREAEESRVKPQERLVRLIRCLQPRETALDAMARLKPKKMNKWQASQKWKKSKMAVDQDTPVSEEDAAKAKQQIEEITSHADKLLARGMLDIYSTRREILISTYQDESGERFRESSESVRETGQGGQETWEYKWPGADEVYSNFSSDNMKDWKEGGFFGDGVLVRKVGSADEWTSSVDINF